jgi:hypothetical protein
MNTEELLLDYHKRIGEIFLAKGQTPFRISRQIWKLHAEYEGKLSRLLTQAAPDGAGVCPNCNAKWEFHDPRVCSVPAPQVA